MSYRISFYADAATYRNKQFTFRVNSHADALGCIKRFQAKGNTIRAAYLQSSREGVVQSTTRIL